MFDKYIKLNVFLISFSIGIFYVYMVQPQKEVVYRFPNPDNVSKLVYKDNNDTCYKYKVEERNCSELNKNQIKSQPILENFKKNKKLNN
tara:strand:+ start:79 stop:345 length:267 start_codon:yes stop_codon:yes gene_type:complete